MTNKLVLKKTGKHRCKDYNSWMLYIKRQINKYKKNANKLT